MRPRRFDATRLTPVSVPSGDVRHCAASDALVASCRQAQLAASEPWAVWAVDDADVARRVCLQLDGSWDLADASTVGRWAIRARALAVDLAWWRPPQPRDHWDAGWARSPTALRGFVPRRATVIVVPGALDEAGQAALADLAQRAPGCRRVIRVLRVPPGAPG